MKTQKNYHYKMQEGDSCNVRSDVTEEQRLIEDHPQNLIEDQYAEVDPVMAAPVKKKSNWLAWAVAAIAAILLIGGCIYLANQDENYTTKKVVYLVKKRPVKVMAANSQTTNLNGVTVSANANDGEASAATVVGSGNDYVYYFANDVSAVPANKVLDNVAAKVENANADVVVSAYASEVGNAAYNKNLSEQRAENIANYLVAHGVPRNHVKVISNGESSKYGDFAHNRRANIHISYNNA